MITQQRTLFFTVAWALVVLQFIQTFLRGFGDHPLSVRPSYFPFGYISWTLARIILQLSRSATGAKRIRTA